MEKAITLFEHMDQELVAWDYDSSVQKLKAMRYKWEHLSIGMMRELEMAHENLSKPGTRTDLTSSKNRQGWGQYCEDVGISRQTAHNWLERWTQIKTQYLQLEDDVQIKDVKVEENPEEPKENPFKERLEQAEKIIKEKNRTVKVLSEQIQDQEKELIRLKEKEKDAAEIDKIRSKVAELKKRQSELLKDSEGVTVILKALVRGRDFFTKECMIIPALNLTEHSKKLMKNDLNALVELVENWLQAIKQRLL